jgi:hypothetical protein
MKRYQRASFLLLLTLVSAAMKAQEKKYPRLDKYLMPQADEVALAKSAAPQNISDHATIRVFTTSGYQTVHEGGTVLCAWSCAGLPEPTFTPIQVRTFITYDAKTRGSYLFERSGRTNCTAVLRASDKTRVERQNSRANCRGSKAAHTKGEIPKRTEVSFAYMWSADQVLGPATHWSSHDGLSSLLRKRDAWKERPGSHLPAIGDDAGTPFAVGTIPEDDKLAMKARPLAKAESHA